ncbi:acetylglutamate kinase [Halosquirtibacter xylanolyticus]|uniref:acetylglutamate kinase n=1 Tax=Halosquirtibacter xylanolyticus TaxID=3374599 RepID=UPI00374A6896|nr:acetylglutamate kinase [Prolixibacteraceae bacterium]
MKKVTIIKVGGAVVESPDSLEAFLNNFVHIEGAKILVHGGGRSATAMAERLQIPTKMVDGRRVTDENMLEIVTMVYGGLVNKNIVAKLQCKKLNALGLTGADMNLIEAHKRPVKDVDYGFVGDIDRINTDALMALISQGITPVVAPLTHDLKGNLLNTNADTIAASLAVGLSAECDVDLYYGFEKNGVLKDANDDHSVITSMTTRDFEILKTSGAIHSGMIPKLTNCFDAIAQGVRRVYIGHVDNINHLDRGTHLHD